MESKLVVTIRIEGVDHVYHLVEGYYIGVLLSGLKIS